MIESENIHPKIITLSKNYSGFVNEIVAFYAPLYKHPFTSETVINSAIICLAYDNDKIIGAIRAISDLSRHASIVDLIVDDNYRKQKIGTKLLQAVISELKKYNVKNIGLTTEPGVDWLVNFYKKNSFASLENNVYLELK